MARRLFTAASRFAGMRRKPRPNTSSVQTSSPLGFLNYNAPGYWPATHVDEYGVIVDEGPPTAGFRGVNLLYRSGITCQNGYTNISESTCLANGWAMHDSSGNVLRNGGFGGVLADPGNLDYQQAWWNASLTAANTFSANSFFIDDTTPSVTDFYGGGAFPVEHPNLTSYKAALVSFAQFVKAQCQTAGRPLPAYNTAMSLDNTGALTTAWWQQFGPHVGYLSIEYWLFVNANTRRIGPEWWNNWDNFRALHPLCKSMGCKFLPLDIAGGQVYGLGTFLLDWDLQGSAYLWAQNYTGTADPWISFYQQARALGAPSGSATQSGGVWTRQFANGQVSVNPVTGVATITGV